MAQMEMGEGRAVGKGSLSFGGAVGRGHLPLGEGVCGDPPAQCTPLCRGSWAPPVHPSLLLWDGDNASTRAIGLG